jgi:hypothetical protein
MEPNPLDVGERSKMRPMRRFFAVGMLIAAAGATAGCSTSASKKALSVCSYNPGHLVTTPTGQVYTTATAPCTPMTTTTTTLPPPLALGTTAALSYSLGAASDSTTVRGEFTIHRLWTNATPVYIGTGIVPVKQTLSQAMDQLLHGTHFSPEQRLKWIGVDLTIQNTGSTLMGLVPGGGGLGAPAFFFVINGHGGLSDNSDISALSGSGYEVGVSGCPFPFPSSQALSPGESVSGCVALAVPAGVKVSTVGFDIQPVGLFPRNIAQWTI